MVGFMCNLYWPNRSSFNSISIFIFWCADPGTKDHLYYFVDWSTQNKFTDCPYNKKLSYLCPRFVITGFSQGDFIRSKKVELKENYTK